MNHSASIDRVPVALGARSYDILIGPGLIKEAGHHIRPLLRAQRVGIVSDDNVAALYLGPLRAALEKAGIAIAGVEVVPPGEGSKDFAHLQKILDGFLDRGAERGMTIIALGGGVIGDLAGFAASILLRGVDFIQIPTTLLAQVDSAVGGKTAIDTKQGKNLIGSFYQPRLVLADLDSLKTLPRRQILAGYAEIVKYGLLGDESFFAWLEDNGGAVIGGDEASLRHAIAQSCRAKAAIVAGDERETSNRALLNLGHSFAHALELEAGFGERLLHGEAVSIGMVMAFRLSALLGLCPIGDAARCTQHLGRLGLPTSLEFLHLPDLESGRILSHMYRDKKTADGQLNLILARGIGQAFIARDVDADAVRAVIDQDLAA